MMLQSGTKDFLQADPGTGTSRAQADIRREGWRGRTSGRQVAREVLQKEGVGGLFRGGTIRAAFTIVGNGLFMGCYEYAKMYLQER